MSWNRVKDDGFYHLYNDNSCLFILDCWILAVSERGSGPLGATFIGSSLQGKKKMYWQLIKKLSGHWYSVGIFLELNVMRSHAEEGKNRHPVR